MMNASAAGRLKINLCGIIFRFSTFVFVCRRALTLLYTFHQHVKARQIYRLNGIGEVKIFPVTFRFPPFLRFGNDHNPELIMRETLTDQPDLVHFHNYYLFSFPYTAVFVKEKLKRPLIVQLHGYNNSSLRKWLYLPCLFALKNADRILYSYKPEKTTLQETKGRGKSRQGACSRLRSSSF